MDGLSAWSTGCAFAVIQTITDLFATSSAEPVMTFLVTLAAIPAAPRSAWMAGRDQSAKKVRGILEHITVQNAQKTCDLIRMDQCRVPYLAVALLWN